MTDVEIKDGVAVYTGAQDEVSISFALREAVNSGANSFEFTLDNSELDTFSRLASMHGHSAMSRVFNVIRSEVGKTTWSVTFAKTIQSNVVQMARVVSVPEPIDLSHRRVV